MLEKRMYFFVPYQLTGIQKGIQCGHTVEQYAHKYKDDIEYVDFVENWMTWIILDGGSTNTNLDNPGTLNNIYYRLLENHIDCAWFYEPDLQDALTSVCFLCDERVFNRELYPDFYDFLNQKGYSTQSYEFEKYLKTLSSDEILEKFPERYEEWIKSLGGLKNVFLRELIRGKRLA